MEGMNKGMKKKNGFTVVELMVSFSLTLVIVYFLIQVVFLLKEIYVGNGVKSDLLNKEAVMNEIIYNDFRNKTVQMVNNCGKNCLLFYFDDNTNATLKINKEENTFHYGDYTTKLVTGSKFGDLDANVTTLTGIPANKYDSFLQIKIPVNNVLIDGDYGVNAILQFNSRTTSIADVTLNGSDGSFLFLKGSSSMIVTDTYEEPGYFVVDQNGKLRSNDSRVTVSGEVGTSAGTYTITYTLVIDEKPVDTKTRTVTVQ